MSDQFDELMSDLDEQKKKPRPAYVLPPVEDIPAHPKARRAEQQLMMTDLDALVGEPKDDEKMKVATPAASAPVPKPAEESDEDMKIIGDEVGTMPVLNAEPTEDLGKTRQISVNDLSSAAVVPIEGESEEPTEDGEDEEVGEKREKKSRSAGGCIRGLVYVILVIGVSFVISYLAIIGAMDVTGMGKKSVPVDVNVPEGASTEQVAELLQENGLIDQPWIFRLYAKVTHADGTLQPGVFTLQPNLGYTGIIKELQTERERETVMVTFKEGATVQQIAKELADHKVCSESDFFKAVNQSNYDDYSFIADISAAERQNRIYLLEGYLFPDTYEFYVDSSAESAIRKMLDNFGTKVLTDQMKTAIAAKGYTVDQVVVMGSIAQWEAGTVEDMPRVMRVVMNRLENTDEFPRLQLDSTEDYVLSIVPTLGGVTVVNTAYNTYEREGLPVGAIGNPGLDAISAALNPSIEPEIINCYYFATDMNTNITYFCETFEEHEAICQEYGIGTYA